MDPADELLDRAYARWAAGRPAESREAALAAMQRGGDAAAALRLLRFIDEVEAAGPTLPAYTVGGWALEEVVEDEGAVIEGDAAAARWKVQTPPLEPRAATPVPTATAAPGDGEDKLLGLVGSLDQIPALTHDLGHLTLDRLDARAAFLASRVDGQLTFAEILDVAGMPRDEACSLLADLVVAGILRGQ